MIEVEPVISAARAESSVMRNCRRLLELRARRSFWSGVVGVKVDDRRESVMTVLSIWEILILRRNASLFWKFERLVAVDLISRAVDHEAPIFHLRETAGNRNAH